MGRKKKNLDPRSKQSPAPPHGAAVDFPTLSNADDTSIADQSSFHSNLHDSQARIEPVFGNESDALSCSTIKLECERALTTLRRGNHTKALRLMKELCSRNENSVHSALIHRVQGTVCVKVAAIIDDLNTKQRHLRNAIESARKAVELSPSSIEFAHFYASLLYEVANDGKEYEEVVQECERALGIEFPIDPAKESLQDEKQQKIPTAEARIAHVQTELRQLIQKSSIYSISSWMKNLGNGEEKFRLIPIRRVTEDPMEVSLVQARRAIKSDAEDLAEKDATKKSDAAREAFLAELALDSKKVVRGGSDNSRHPHEKTEEKKRSKEYRKTKDSKMISGPELDVLHDEAVDGE